MTLAGNEKLNRWASKLLDTGKRNNLISFKDAKASSAEIVSPDCESIFGRCAVGHVFEVFDPKIRDNEDEDPELQISIEEEPEGEPKTRQEYIDRYSKRLRKATQILVYAQTPNPMIAVKNIAKKAQEHLDETGINVSYMAFGFIRWNEKEGSEVFYRAPLLLIHTRIITGSVLDPIKIEICDDDVIVNPTFNYLMQAQYGVSLPEYTDGETLESYYTKVRSCLPQKEWEVLNSCKLGIFAFQKINMYEDLMQNADEVLSSEIVQELLNEKHPDSFSSGYSSEETVPVKNPLIELHTVVDADSSQIEAIEMAKSGKSFVLQGPPGTGKSQTITNIISEGLHDGKKILFVSEKQAALNVVFDKLKKADLADFCLELHSHKANKKAVIAELNRTLEAPRYAVSSFAQEEIRQKEAAQKRLDEYASELHKERQPIRKSLYQLYELYAAQRSYPEYHVPIKNLPEKGQDYLLKAVTLLEQYADFIPSVGQDWRQNPWYGFKTLVLDYNGSNQLKEDLTTLTGGYRNLQSSTQRIKDKYETRELNYTDTLSWQEILAFSAKSDVVTPAILSREGYESALPRIEKLKELSSIIMPLQEQLFRTYSPEIVREINGREVHAKLTGQFASGLTRAFSGEYRTLIAGMQPYLKNGKLKYRQAVECAELLRQLQSAQAEFETQEAAGRGFIGACYRGIHTDWSHVEDTLNTLRRYYDSGSGAFYALARMEASEFEEGRNEFSADAEELQNEIQLVEEAKQRVSQHFMPQVLDLEKDSYVKCLRKLELCLAEFDKLANWRSFLELLKQIDQAELLPYIDTAIKEAIAPENIVGAFKRAFYKQWIEYIVFAVPTLAAFTRSRQDQAVEIFTKKDEIQYRISKLQIKAELSQKRPSLDLTAGGSAVSILRREGQKKRKQMPIRKLLSETGMLVQQIKPCFLMSPLSVSTFLEPGKISFDMVIFDEASQIFPQDAIGAIYRGKQLIVVGDSRQMPPSNFFSAALDVDDDDEETGDITDFESILDICSAVFTTQRLAWHYRSHYEQLIAFSNLNFYNNTLVTFPSSSKDHRGIGVDYFYVGGTFDRRSKTNRAEAEFIVDLIYQNIEKYPERSLGVVAFSVAQQNLIDRLLSKRREADPSHEAFFGSDNREPFFIKNLETVQGDERDTIIFSVAYAKDSQGRFIQNFGPLNRVGGERRLNVAVTRAKDNVLLVSSIRYTDINLSNSGSEGVRLLRAYLDYAQNGEDALERAITVSGEDQFDSYFEQEVCDFLRDQGYTVDTQVGCSGYRIDLGLRKPNSSNYVLAIECDGATYHSAKNARDRDCLRQRVLENMGWRFYRIWSTDWFRNTSVEKERLLNAVKAALEQDDGRDEPEADSQPQSEKTSDQVAEMAFSEVIPEKQIEFEKYQALNAQEIFRYCRDDPWRAIRMILQTEAPLSEEYLLKRIVFYFQREKVTKVVQQEYERMMRGCEHDGIIRRNGFLYLKGMTKYSFRVPGTKREIKYISPEELSMGMYAVIKQNVSVTKEGLYHTLTNLLGFSRTGAGIVSRYDSILGDLIKYQLVKDENGIISVVV